MSFFKDIIMPDKRARSTKVIDDLDLLEPVTRKIVASIIMDAKKKGVEYMVFETFRSKERQLQLFKQGASKLKNVGVHHYGLACDIVRKVDGQPSWKGDFSLLGKLAHSYGLLWGGDWGKPDEKHSFLDVYHVQRCAIHRQLLLFKGKWYPDANYNPYHDQVNAVNS